MERLPSTYGELVAAREERAARRERGRALVDLIIELGDGGWWPSPEEEPRRILVEPKVGHVPAEVAARQLTSYCEMTQRGPWLTDPRDWYLFAEQGKPPPRSRRIRVFLTEFILRVREAFEDLRQVRRRG